MLISEIISKVLAGELTAEQGLDLWPKEEAIDNHLVRNAWHTLCHYATDDDIRIKDPDYGLHQRRTLEELAAKLKKERK
jgi:hypothetical protein